MMNINEPPCRLTVAEGQSCGPVAVGSITGAGMQEVENAIIRAAREDGENPAHLRDCSFRHQARAVELLGYRVLIPGGKQIDAKEIGKSLRREEGWYSQTISEFLVQNMSDRVLICEAIRLTPDQKEEAHTFAVDGRWYFDNNTKGKAVTESDMPSGLGGFKVVRWFETESKNV